MGSVDDLEKLLGLKPLPSAGPVLLHEEIKEQVDAYPENPEPNVVLSPEMDMLFTQWPGKPKESKVSNQLEKSWNGAGKVAGKKKAKPKLSQEKIEIYEKFKKLVTPVDKLDIHRAAKESFRRSKFPVNNQSVELGEAHVLQAYKFEGECDRGALWTKIAKYTNSSSSQKSPRNTSRLWESKNSDALLSTLSQFCVLNQETALQEIHRYFRANGLPDSEKQSLISELRSGETSHLKIVSRVLVDRSDRYSFRASFKDKEGYSVHPSNFRIEFEAYCYPKVSDFLYLTFSRIGPRAEFKYPDDPVESVTVRRLRAKPVHEWGTLEWKLAKRVTNKLPSKDVKVMPVESKITPKPLLTKLDAPQLESFNRSKSQALVEMKFLDLLFSKAMTTGHADPEKDDGKGKIEKRIHDIAEKTFREFKIPIHQTKKIDNSDLLSIYYKVKIDKVPYAIHAHFVKGSKLFMLSLWDKEENRLLLVLSEGYLRQYYYLVGIGKERLRSWMRGNHNHGKSGSGEDRR